MAFFNTKPHTAFFLATFITCFLFLLTKVKSSDSICFTSTSFGDDVSHITFQVDAKASDGTLVLTELDSNGNPTRNSVGRALFSSPIHLWESSTGRVASFSTTFSFIAHRPSGTPADGITFFLIPVGAVIPENKEGGGLGIYGGTNTESFVAVEFDTFKNGWDPAVPHIGIDINNVTSVKTTNWDTSGVPGGSIAFAKITYDADSGDLNVTLTYPNVEGSNESTLTYNIDLTKLLPEWVQVGLSASTGDYVEIHKILSWSFTANLASISATNKKDM